MLQEELLVQGRAAGSRLLLTKRWLPKPVSAGSVRTQQGRGEGKPLLAGEPQPARRGELTPHIPSSSLGEKQSLPGDSSGQAARLRHRWEPRAVPQREGTTCLHKGKGGDKNQKIFGQEIIQLHIKAPGVHSWLTKYQDLL